MDFLIEEGIFLPNDKYKWDLKQKYFQYDSISFLEKDSILNLKYVRWNIKNRIKNKEKYNI